MAVSLAGSLALVEARFLGVVAGPDESSSPACLAATSKIALRSAFGFGVSIGSGAGSFLNFCQSPVTLRIAATASVGCAPTPSQYSARSASTSMNDGSLLGWYLPIVSIARPLRRVRASATTMR